MLARCPCKPFDLYQRNIFVTRTLRYLSELCSYPGSITIVFVLPGCLYDEWNIIKAFLKSRHKEKLKHIVLIEPLMLSQIVKAQKAFFLLVPKNINITIVSSYNYECTTQHICFIGLDIDNEMYLPPQSLKEFVISGRRCFYYYAWYEKYYMHLLIKSFCSAYLIRTCNYAIESEMYLHKNCIYQKHPLIEGVFEVEDLSSNIMHAVRHEDIKEMLAIF